MCGNHGSYGISILLVLIASTSLSDDDTQLNGIYREFFRSPVNVENIRKLYPENIIHVGRADAAIACDLQTGLRRNPS